MAYEDGSLVAQTASKHFLTDDVRWTTNAEAVLRRLGWSEPEPPRRPNWLVVCPTRSPSITEISVLTVATLRLVFALGHEDRVVVKLYSSPRRGGTPASESPLADGGAPSYVHGFGPTRSPVPAVGASRWASEPWADYYRVLYPGAARPRSNFDAWKYATTAVDIARALWGSRERALLYWEAGLGPDPCAWPLAHPPVVLWSPYIARGACLACTWIDLEATSDLRRAGRRARKHSISAGDDPTVVRSLRVPISERGGPIDKPLSEKWV
jgi:hypothetical protein